MTFPKLSIRQIDELNSVTIASPALPNDYGSEALYAHHQYGTYVADTFAENNAAFKATT
jgi:hypothetical protein